MKTKHVKDILVAIESVRIRAKRALEANQMGECYRLVGDLLSLELCLVIEIEKLMPQIEDDADDEEYAEDEEEDDKAA